MLSAQSLIRCAPQAEPESASAPIEPYSTVRYQDQQPETACRRSAQWCTWHGLPSHAGMTGRLGGAYLLSSSTVPVWILRRILLPCLLASGAAVSRRVFERSVSFHSRQNPLPISDVTSRVERGGERSLPRWYIYPAPPSATALPPGSLPDTPSPRGANPQKKTRKRHKRLQESAQDNHAVTHNDKFGRPWPRRSGAIDCRPRRSKLHAQHHTPDRPLDLLANQRARPTPSFPVPSAMPSTLFRFLPRQQLKAVF